MNGTTIGEAVGRLRGWTISQALPLWSSAGVDPLRGTFVERLSTAGEPLFDVPRRTMVQARQIYVFAHAHLLGVSPAGRDLALGAAERLVADRHAVDGQPGWVFSADRDGRVVDPRRDLYTHAFVLYGLAWAHRLSPSPRFVDAALTTIDFLDRAFAAPRGGYVSGLPAAAERLEQNPHMHLFEAMLAWWEATGEARFLARAGELHALMAARFFQPTTGILPEYFDATWNPCTGVTGRICEPGHHYEWSWLLRTYGRLIGRPDAPIATTLKAFADAHGRDRDGLVVDQTLDDGGVHRASRRTWPHTEAIKAEVAAHEAGDGTAPERAARIIGRLLDVFLGRPVAGGWIDQVDADGRPLVDFMPASTLYHVFLAMAEAHRVWDGA